MPIHVPPSGPRVQQPCSPPRLSDGKSPDAKTPCSAFSSERCTTLRPTKTPDLGPPTQHMESAAVWRPYAGRPVPRQAWWTTRRRPPRRRPKQLERRTSEPGRCDLHWRDASLRHRREARVPTLLHSTRRLPQVTTPAATPRADCAGEGARSGSAHVAQGAPGVLQEGRVHPRLRSASSRRPPQMLGHRERQTLCTPLSLRRLPVRKPRCIEARAPALELRTGEAENAHEGSPRAMVHTSEMLELDWRAEHHVPEIRRRRSG